MFTYTVVQERVSMDIFRSKSITNHINKKVIPNTTVPEDRYSRGNFTMQKEENNKLKARK